MPLSVGLRFADRPVVGIDVPGWRRLVDLLVRIENRIRRRLDQVSPLVAPAMLDIGSERADGTGIDDLLEEAAASLIAEVMAPRPQGKLPLGPLGTPPFGTLSRVVRGGGQGGGERSEVGNVDRQKRSSSLPLAPTPSLPRLGAGEGHESPRAPALPA